MNEYAELRSLAGMIYNDVKITKIKAERIYCALPMQSGKFENLMRQKVSHDSLEWIIRIAVCESYNQHYIYIESNSCSCFINSLIEEGELPPDLLMPVFVPVSEIKAEEIKNMLLSLGREYFSHLISDFDLIMANLVSVIPCRIQFSPIISHTRGYYVPQLKQIVIATNAPQFQIIFSTIHEYVHYFLKSTEEDSLNIERASSETVIEYISNSEEYICNFVAYKVVLNIIPNTISQIISGDMNLMLKDLEKLSKSPFKSSHEILYAMKENIHISPEASTVLSFLISQDLISDVEKTKAESKIDNIANFILNKLNTNKRDSIDEGLLNKKEYAQNGCVILNEKDNTTLYRYLKDNIIPIVVNKDKIVN